jgi:hypothetical protein
MPGKIAHRSLEHNVHREIGVNATILGELISEELEGESKSRNENEENKEEKTVLERSSSWTKTQSTASRPFSLSPLSETLSTFDATPFSSLTDSADMVQQTPVVSSSSFSSQRPDRDNLSYPATQVLKQSQEESSSLEAPLPTITILAMSNATTFLSKRPIPSISSSIAEGATNIDDETLSGTASGLPKFNTTGSLPSITTAKNVTYSRPTPAVAVIKPLPGKNQPIPVLEQAAAVSSMRLAEAETTSIPKILQQLSEDYASSSYPSTLTPIHPKSLSSFQPMIESPSISIPFHSSFVTLTKTRQEEQLIRSTGTAMFSQGMSAQPIIPSISSDPVSSSIKIAPTGFVNVSVAADTELERVTRLTPVARTLFIVLGVLGE